MTYKPFDLEAVMRGEKVITREGKEAKFVFRSPIKSEKRALLFVYKFSDDEWHSIWCGINGKYFPASNEEYKLDIVMLPKTKTYWVNIFFDKHNGFSACGKTFLTQEDAINSSDDSGSSLTFVKTISFEVEE